MTNRALLSVACKVLGLYLLLHLVLDLLKSWRQYSPLFDKTIDAHTRTWLNIWIILTAVAVGLLILMIRQSSRLSAWLDEWGLPSDEDAQQGLQVTNLQVAGLRLISAWFALQGILRLFGSAAAMLFDKWVFEINPPYTAYPLRIVFTDLVLEILPIAICIWIAKNPDRIVAWLTVRRAPPAPPPPETAA